MASYFYGLTPACALKFVAESAWYDATTSEMPVKFVRCTLTAYPPGFTPPQDNGASTPSPSPS